MGSLERLTSIHSFTVLVQTVTSGESMGQSRVYAPAAPPTTFVGHAYPGRPKKVKLLGMEAQVITHSIYYSNGANNGADPDVEEDDRILWTDKNNLVMRVVGIPIDCGGFGRMWVILADARRDDNISIKLN